MVKGELSTLKNISELFVPKDVLRKINKIKIDYEKINLYKHAIKSNLELKLHGIENEIKKYSKKVDTFNVLIKTNLLKTKIRYFYITYEKKDIKEVLSLFKEIEKEIKLFKKVK